MTKLTAWSYSRWSAWERCPLYFKAKFLDKSVVEWLVQVYDELSISAPAAEADELMRVLRETMEIPYLDVPLRTKGKRGASWGTLEKCE